MIFLILQLSIVQATNYGCCCYVELGLGCCLSMVAMELLKNEGPSTYGILGIVNGSCTILLTKIRTNQSRTELKVKHSLDI